MSIQQSKKIAVGIFQITDTKFVIRLKVRVNNREVNTKKTINVAPNTKVTKSLIKYLESERYKLRENTIKGKTIVPLTVSFSDVWSEYIAMKSISLAPETIRSSSFFVSKWVLPILKDKPLEQITSRDLQSIINTILTAGKANRTAHSVQFYLRPLFNYYNIQPNPATNLTIPKYDNTVEFTLPKDKLQELLQRINTHSNPVYRAFFTFLFQGRRLNEVISLKWDAIDLDNSTYTIQALYNKVRKKMVYPLRDELKEVLLPLLEDKMTDYIFSNDDGNTIPTSRIRDEWERILKSVGITHLVTGKSRGMALRLHDIRHIIGNTLVDNGVPLEHIAKVLGHTSTAITHRYSKVSIQIADTALDVFSKATSSTYQSNIA